MRLIDVALTITFALALVTGISTLRVKKGPMVKADSIRSAYYDVVNTDNKKHMAVAFVCFDLFFIVLWLYVLFTLQGWALGAVGGALGGITGVLCKQNYDFFKQPWSGKNDAAL